METVTIETEHRSSSGKKASAALRRDGKIPCVLYGGSSNEHLAINAKALQKALSGASGKRVILQLSLNAGDVRHTILQELQFHPITDVFVHADLIEIDMNKPLRMKLPIALQGDPVGVKIKGGQLRHHLNDLTVECLPDKMPTEINIDITNLDMRDVLKVSDLSLGEGATAINPADSLVVSIAEAKVVATKGEGEEATVADAAAVATPAATEKKE